MHYVVGIDQNICVNSIINVVQLCFFGMCWDYYEESFCQHIWTFLLVDLSNNFCGYMTQKFLWIYDICGYMTRGGWSGFVTGVCLHAYLYRQYQPLSKSFSGLYFHHQQLYVFLLFIFFTFYFFNLIFLVLAILVCVLWYDILALICIP